MCEKSEQYNLTGTCLTMKNWRRQGQEDSLGQKMQSLETQTNLESVLKEESITKRKNS